ncbi:MAG: hypothetical protein V8T10_07180 [Merdibacter sp.]
MHDPQGALHAFLTVFHGFCAAGLSAASFHAAGISLFHGAAAADTHRLCLFFYAYAAVPNFILGEITLTLPGQLAAIAFYLMAFVLFAVPCFTPLYLFQERCSFWQAAKKSVKKTLALPLKKRRCSPRSSWACF